LPFEKLFPYFFYFGIHWLEFSVEIGIFDEEKREAGVKAPDTKGVRYTTIESV
jgi:hypothetical protein